MQKNQSRKFLVLALLIGVGLITGWLVHRSGAASEKEVALNLRNQKAEAKKVAQSNSVGNSQSNSPKAQTDSTGNSATGTASQANGLSMTPERKSLDVMTKTLSAFSRPGHSIDELVTYLSRAQTQPKVILDKNEVTGGMKIVRTSHLFPGTRYFHAQFFEDEKGVYFPQHMSFEFKPGEQSMPQAIESVRQSFQLTGKPTVANSSFMQWDLGEGYVVWIKKLDVDDLSHNPYNAYTQADIGSIRVAVEMNPHEGHEHGD